MGFRDTHGKGQSAEDKVPAADLPIFKGCPNLYECLVGYTDGSGIHLTNCTLTLYCSDGRLKASVNDRTNGLIGFITLENDVGLVTALNKSLDEGRIEWKRQDQSRKK